MKKLLLSVVLLGLLSACASTDKKNEAPVVDKSGQTQTQGDGGKTTGLGDSSFKGHPYDDPNNVLYKHSVYYELDSYAVKDEFRSLVEAHAQYIKQNPQSKVFLQGNCDERGSREYNIALGQKRAESVKKMMSVLGVPESQMETVSFGEEKPMAEGHDESAWAENRRTDIIYQGK